MVLLTEPETAERMKIPAETLRYLRRLGEAPPHVRIGRAVRYDEADVAAYLDGRKIGGTA